MILRESWAIQILGYMHILSGMFVLPRLMYLYYLYTPASRGSLGQEGAYKIFFFASPFAKAHACS